MSESFRDQLSRVEQMSLDDNGETWDLSENDLAALKAVIADRQRLAAKSNDMRQSLATVIEEMESNKWAPAMEFLGDDGYAAQWAQRLRALVEIPPQTDAPEPTTENRDAARPAPRRLGDDQQDIGKIRQ